MEPELGGEIGDGPVHVVRPPIPRVVRFGGMRKLREHGVEAGEELGILSALSQALWRDPLQQGDRIVTRHAPQGRINRAEQ